MPQLDILIFKYENINFIISFFLFFFLNQYFIFPSIVKNITLRRRLITRALINEGEINFFLILVKKYNVNLIDNFIFLISVVDIRNLISNLVSTIINYFNFFINLKQSNFVKLLKQFAGKLGLVVWSNNILFLEQIN